MARSALRYRGIRPEVDTTQAAEWDISDLGVSDADLELIARNLCILPNATMDRVVGNVRVREIAGLDVIFIFGRQDEEFIITICGLRRPSPTNPTEALLKRMEPLATLRGALGL